MSRINTHTNISVVLKDKLPPPIRDRRSLLAYRSVGWPAYLIWQRYVYDLVLTYRFYQAHTPQTHTHTHQLGDNFNNALQAFLLFFFFLFATIRLPAFKWSCIIILLAKLKMSSICRCLTSAAAVRNQRQIRDAFQLHR